MKKLNKLIKQLEKYTGIKYASISVYLDVHILSIIKMPTKEKFILIYESNYDIFEIVDTLEVDLNSSIINIKSTKNIPKYIFPVALSKNNKILLERLKKYFDSYNNGKHIYEFWKVIFDGKIMKKFSNNK